MANNMMNMQKIMKQAQKMQTDLENQQKDLKNKDFEGKDPSGMVKVTVSGDKKVKAIDLDPEVVDPDDLDMLEDLLIAAFNDAMDQVDKASEQLTSKMTNNMPNMPNT